MYSFQDLMSTRRSGVMCLEDIPSLSISKLRQGGLIPAKAGAPPFEPMAIFRPADSENLISVIFIAPGPRDSTIEFTVLHKEGTEKTIVEISKKRQGVVDHYYFICPLTNRPVRKLYLFDNGWVFTRHCFGILYASQVLSHSNQLVNRRDDTLREIRGSEGREPR